MSHPNTVEHHIEWIELYGVKKDGQVVDLSRADFASTYTNPNVRFQVPVADFKALDRLANEIVNKHKEYNMLN